MDKINYWFWNKNKTNKKLCSDLDSSNESEDDANFCLIKKVILFILIKNPKR
jgi:hypothetical protein